MPQFTKGNTLGTGRRLGSRNRSTLLLEAIGEEGIAAVVRKVVDAAQYGNMRAASILLARAWPCSRSRPVVLDLPPVETAEGIVQAHAAVVGLMSAGELTPEEASAVGNVLENQRRALVTIDHEKRLQALENEELDGGRQPSRAA